MTFQDFVLVFCLLAFIAPYPIIVITNRIADKEYEKSKMKDKK